MSGRLTSLVALLAYAGLQSQSPMRITEAAKIDQAEAAGKSLPLQLSCPKDVAY